MIGIRVNAIDRENFVVGLEECSSGERFRFGGRVEQVLRGNNNRVQCSNV